MFDIKNIIDFFQNHNIPDNICDFCDLIENNFYDIFGENYFQLDHKNLSALKEEYILTFGDKIFVNHVYDENYFIIQSTDTNIVILQHDSQNVIGGFFDENNFLHYIENNEEIVFDKTFVIDYSLIQKFHIQRKDTFLIINQNINDVAYGHFKNMSIYSFFDGQQSNNFCHYFQKRNIDFKEIFILQSLYDIFLKNGNTVHNDDVIYKPLKEMEKSLKKNFKNWSEEDLFYFKLKYC